MNDKVIKAEVLVVGAGASGIPAAIGAARMGVNVLLVEEDLSIGGAATDSYVCTFCGGPRCGVVKEMENLLRTNYQISEDSSFFLPSSFERTFYQLLSREKKIRVMTGCRATDVIMDGPRVAGVKVNGNIVIRAKVTIDASGSGAVALMAGCNALYGTDAQADFNEKIAPYKRSNNVQSCTWMYISQQMNSSQKPFDMTRLEHYPLGMLSTGFSPSPNIFLHWGCSVKCKDTRDSVALGAAQQEALSVMEKDHALLKENGFVIYLAPKIGIREQSRIVCEHIITLEDLCSRNFPEDTIAVGTYGIDVWGGKKELWGGAKKKAVQVSGYGIPYRAIVPKGIDGLLIAGKAIGGSHIAMSAYRVQPIVGSAGQASGVAAALCSKQNIQPREIDYTTLKKALRQKNQNIQLEI